MSKDIQKEYGFQFPSEFKQPESHEDVVKVFNAFGFYNGRMIAGSKSHYRKEHPDDMIVFNANIIMEGFGKVFFGDINITEDYKILKKIANALNTVLYILTESTARFDQENRPIKELIVDSIWNTNETYK
tara:strand:+ start:920 stop:1309 length:390 start_codon:yes stop_codon:yes gene_type:complete